MKIVKCTCAYSSTVPGWSDYLGIPGYSEKEGWCGLYLSSSWHLPSMVRVSQDTLRKGGGVTCIPYHPGAFPVWSELKISVYSDERGWCGLHMCSSWYYPEMVRVFWELCPGMVQHIVYLKNFCAIRWCHWTSLLF